jgi:ABC-2 type transport system ATP-binding protein
MIKLEYIYKTIKSKPILVDISYTFEKGKVYGIYGHNGSGKTMLLRAIAGLIRINEGTVRINDKKLHEDISFPENTGIVIENMELLHTFSAAENLRLLAKIKNVATDEDIKTALARVGLDPDSPLKVKKFSLGMKQRLNIAQAIFENQSIILLDEPTNALDEKGVQLIYDVIREERDKGAIIIMATHHKEDLKALCDVVLKIDSGRIIEEEEA